MGFRGGCELLLGIVECRVCGCINRHINTGECKSPERAMVNQRWVSTHRTGISSFVESCKDDGIRTSLSESDTQMLHTT